ncbi:MAG: AbrB/MazE/SpoVT family DNA-binding domain-containing protein [Candidatus Paceibacterota bacterium]
MTTHTKVQQWGNSYGIRLPRDIAHKLGLETGSVLDIEVEGDAVVLRVPKSKDTVTDLARQITPENRHDEIDWGGPLSDEIW